MNPWYIDPVHITLRLAVALLLGGLVGFERERNSHAAGFRTNILVCVGSALIMLLSIYGFREFANEPNVRLDPARLAAQVISGIGFLGAGTILRNGMSITGLTTAASLWVVAAIGLAVGAGFYYAALIATFFVLVSLWGLNIAERRFFHGKRIYLMKISSVNRPGLLGLLSGIMEASGVQIRQLTLEERLNGDEHELQMLLSLRVSKITMIVPLVEEIQAMDGVRTVAIE